MKLQSTTVALMAALVLLMGHARCEDPTNAEDVENVENETTVAVQNEEYASKGVPTYVGPIEKMILMLLKPVEITEDTLNRIGKGIGKGIKEIIDRVPLLRKAKEKARTGKTIADVLNPFKDKIKAIYPGTKWCGDGDIADNPDDLGMFKDTDACCRAHDSCLDGIAAQEERHGLLNNGLFTRSACPCDEEFYTCLKNATNLLATKIGTTYFNLLRPQCFKEYYPIVGCKQYSGRRLIHDKCVDYKFDKNGTQKYQWFDNPDFLNFIELV